jgi:solute carrier family 25 oxoglutarate transporter 11
VSPIALGREIIRKEGARALYSGLDSAILRQVLYGTTRLGLFRYYY